MDQDSIARQLRSWLTRSLPSHSCRTVDDLRVSLASDVGLKRTENQDKVILLRAQVTPVKSFIVGVLCDGMGGMVDGEACAALAISSFISSCIRNRSLSVDQRLLYAVRHANSEVFNEYRGDGGATLSAFIVDSSGNASSVNVGDSRLYVVRGSNVTQLSTDDTLAGQLNRKIEDSPMNGKLLQFIGIGEELEPHQLEVPDLASISKIVMTSDGVHYINEDTFSTMLVQKIESSDLSNRLIQVAKWCGGHDNATNLVISEPLNILSKSISTLTGTVQLWDHHGDVCFIGIDKSTSNKPEADDVGNSKLNKKDLIYETESEVNLLDSGSDGKLEKCSKQKRQYRKNKKDSSESNNDESKKEIPQLRIDFDE
ncbi:PP2C family protein-serine/threonine phosphatase [Vibrio anguillarum]|uniref:PP2C family protein-serine/threonine phosphatase n=1 Tax=Vibrio anguillarum TaxID=55601 RepID=UPI0002FA5CD6|nr:serine/threonine-protein phosphatase [Vibrio anguillarum]OEE41241.1 hypothetical protein A1QU_05550 [Vibrio anguillarum]